MNVSLTTIKNVLTRTSGYLTDVTSHSMQPYCGCAFGNSLCGVGCYVKHNGHLLKGRPWGSFLEVRTNAADSYRAHYEREQAWGRKHRERFSIFCSSATDPFVPQERRYGITTSLLQTMVNFPPDSLILQTHSHAVVDSLELLLQLADQTSVRIHVTIETDRERLPGLPRHATPIDKRFDACRTLQQAGLFTVVTVAPLLPIADPPKFFERIAGCADACVLDHFVEGDGSPDGRRTLRTELPKAMAEVCPESVQLEYREQIANIARAWLPGRVGIGISGFAGEYF